VALADGASLDYDRLVVATGATTGYFAVPGASEHSFPLYTLADARRLRNHVLGRLEAADAHPEDFDGGAPTFVVVGGGATGVEISGALLELLAVSVLRDRLRIDPERSKVVLLEAGERLLPGFEQRASAYAYQTLGSRGVDVRLRTPVAEVTDQGVRLQDGEWIPAAVVVWAGGVTVDGTLAASLPTPHGKGGRVALEPDLSVAGHPEVFVVGDAGAVPWGPRRAEPCPQVAQVAIQSGRHAARQIRRQLTGLPTTPFAYHDKGLMATIGRHAAVAQLRGGLILRGTLAGWRGSASISSTWWDSATGWWCWSTGGGATSTGRRDPGSSSPTSTLIPEASGTNSGLGGATVATWRNGSWSSCPRATRSQTPWSTSTAR